MIHVYMNTSYNAFEMNTHVGKYSMNINTNKYSMNINTNTNADGHTNTSYIAQMSAYLCSNFSLEWINCQKVSPQLEVYILCFECQI